MCCVCAVIVLLRSQTSYTYRGGLWGKVFLADMCDDASSQSIAKDIGHSSKSIPGWERAVRMQLVAPANMPGVFMALKRVNLHPSNPTAGFADSKLRQVQYCSCRYREEMVRAMSVWAQYREGDGAAFVSSCLSFWCIDLPVLLPQLMGHQHFCSMWGWVVKLLEMPPGEKILFIQPQHLSCLSKHLSHQWKLPTRCSRWWCWVPCDAQILNSCSVLILQVSPEKLNFLLCERKRKAARILDAVSSLSRVAVKDKSATHVSIM